MTSIDVPAKVVVGDRVWFNCSYDLEHDQLYSIKWYKDSPTPSGKQSDEIYRFLPNGEVRKTDFKSSGLHVIVSCSGRAEATCAFSANRRLFAFVC